MGMCNPAACNIHTFICVFSKMINSCIGLFFFLNPDIWDIIGEDNSTNKAALTES